MYVVTAYKRGLGSLFVFGPFPDEDVAGKFADKVIATPGWDLNEVPKVNDPAVFGTGEERL